MRKILLVLGVLIVVSIMVVVIFKPEKQKIEQESKLESRDLTVELRVNGATYPRNRITLKPTGRVEKVCVKEGDTVKKGKVVARTSSSDRAALIDSAENAQEREEFEKFWKSTPLKSPIDGTVIKNNLEPGQTNSQELELIIADDLIVYANIDETDVKHIAPGLDLKMYLDAYPDVKFEGTVEHIAYEAHAEKGSGVTVYETKIKPIGKPKMFKSGMGVVITIAIKSKKDAMSISNIFIKEDGQKKTVTVKTGTAKKPIFETREVKTGITDGKFTEIISGLNAGETVVTLSQKAKKPKAGGRAG
ncbi:RND transporter [Endomicrobiia bacterium]|nr:RND transporter [Endomicrobiia bacterium]GHT74195.1 RND transporter [Endomicrobiia bacterium]